jgi:hypothetical protein
VIEKSNLIGRDVEPVNMSMSTDPFWFSPLRWRELGYGPLEVVAVGCHQPTAYVSDPVDYVVVSTPAGMRNVRLQDVRLAEGE